MTELDLVGIQEIAEMAGAKKQGNGAGTVNVWRSRGLLPAEEWTVSGRPVWRRETIQKWLEKTGRLPAAEAKP